MKEKTWQYERVIGVPVVAQQERTWLVAMRTRVWSLALPSGLMIPHYHELWCRSGLYLALLWLWGRPAAAALIRPLAWELLYAMGVALKRPKKKKKKKKKKEIRKVWGGLIRLGDLNWENPTHWRWGFWTDIWRMSICKRACQWSERKSGPTWLESGKESFLMEDTGIYYFQKVILHLCVQGQWWCSSPEVDGDLWKLWERHQWFGPGRWW